MTEREFLLNEYEKQRKDYFEKKKAFFTNPSIGRIDPFKIADGLYYVGDKKVCIHLIDTGDGLILIDSGYLGASHLLVDSIWRAGFDPRNVRWILHTHGHFDHFGASEEFAKMYGTKLAISRVDAQLLREKPHYAHIDKTLYPLANIPRFDHEIEDGEIFSMGNVQIRCVLTPGHTQGVLTLFFPVTENGKTYLAGLYGGAGIKAMSLPYICYNEDPEDCPQQMLASVEKIWDEPVQIHLGNHPYNNHTLEKRRQQLAEGGNPFIDANSWHDFLRELQQDTIQMMEDNEALKKKMHEVLRAAE